jgi:hypothetical protein
MNNMIVLLVVLLLLLQLTNSYGYTSYNIMKNNRIGNRFFSSADFLCAGFTFLDFDLKNYLMPHDLNSPFVRRKDEYADPSLAPDYLNKLPEKNAY